MIKGAALTHCREITAIEQFVVDILRFFVVGIPRKRLMYRLCNVRKQVLPMQEWLTIDLSLL